MSAERTESRDRFERVILPRVKRAVEAIALIGNGAARNYETTPEEIAELLAEVRASIEGVEARYAKHLGTPAPQPASSPAPAPAPTTAPANGDWAETLAALGVMHQHRVPMLAHAVSDSLVAPLITHLINRLAEMAAERAA